MVWDCMSSYGVGRLHIVSGTVKAMDYIEILQNKLLPTARDRFGNQSWIFKDDNAPCQRERWRAVGNIEADQSQAEVARECSPGYGINSRQELAHDLAAVSGRISRQSLQPSCSDWLLRPVSSLVRFIDCMQQERSHIMELKTSVVDNTRRKASFQR
ncbi:hypothetical protein TNCV_3896061 [Trichonephila clavipes]|nr:hypothetical protein TNCV_3896061 [Trichonephila clavipes]